MAAIDLIVLGMIKAQPQSAYGVPEYFQMGKGQHSVHLQKSCANGGKRLYQREDR